MSFLEHLEELRRRIIYSLLAVAVAFFACWYYAERIYAIIRRPIDTVLAGNHLPTDLVYTNPTAPFNMAMKIAFVTALFVACPVVLYQVWAFIAPGLYRRERRYVVPFMFSSVFLFVAGGVFGYLVAFPAALDFLIRYGAPFHIKPMITIGEYVDLFLTIMVGLGVIFEMPILVFFLSLMGIVSPGWMWRNFRYSILVIFIIAAIVTPTTDIVNMCLFAAPMVGLYGISIFVAWLVHPKFRKARAKKA